MKIKLVNEWRLLHRLWSSKLQYFALFLLLLGEAAQNLLFAWGVLPHEFKQTVPEEWITAATVFVLVASIAARYVREQKHHERAKQDRAALDTDASQ